MLVNMILRYNRKVSTLNLYFHLDFKIEKKTKRSVLVKKLINKVRLSRWLDVFFDELIIIDITYYIRTTDLIFILIITTFRPICPPAFFRCLISNSGIHTESQTKPIDQNQKVQFVILYGLPSST